MGFPEPLQSDQEQLIARTSYWWWRSRLVSPCFVYVIQAAPATPVKIGVAKDVPARLATLQTGNPYQLNVRFVLPGQYELEWQLHRKLKGHRMQGEWFEGSPSEAMFPWFRRLSDAMVAAYDDSGKAPSHRQPGFSWPRHHGSKAVVVTRMKPEPVAPDIAAARLAGEWMRPQRRGDWRPGGGGSSTYTIS